MSKECCYNCGSKDISEIEPREIITNNQGLPVEVYIRKNYCNNCGSTTINKAQARYNRISRLNAANSFIDWREEE